MRLAALTQAAKDIGKELLKVALKNLDSALPKAISLNCIEELKEIFYSKALIYNSLGNIK
jgi:hypothetical protein